MSRYSKIIPGIWDDDKVRELSAPKPNAQTLWFYIITGPHVTSIPGLWRLSPGVIAEYLDWPTSAVRRFLAEIEAKSLVLIDFRSKVVLVPGRFKHDEPTSTNVIKHWRTRFDELPDTYLKGLWLKQANDFMKGLSEAFREAFAKAFRTVVRIPQPEPEPEPQPQPDPGPEPEPKTRSQITPKTGASESRKGGNDEPVIPPDLKPKPKDQTVDEQLEDRRGWKAWTEQQRAQIAADPTPYDKPGDAAKRLDGLIHDLAGCAKMENAIGPGEIKSRLRAGDRAARAKSR